jgi:hypothetical protein
MQDKTHGRLMFLILVVNSVFNMFTSNANPISRNRVKYDGHPFDHATPRNRSFSRAGYQPIRISVVFDNDNMQTNRIDFLKDKLLPAATKFWKNTLSVWPVLGTLRLEPTVQECEVRVIN